MIIAIEKILPNPDQPRTEFDADELDALAASLAQHGLINPIAVEQVGETYILIDGERRVRAAKLAGWAEIEASVKPAGRDRLALALVGNIQRKDMSPLDQARAFQRLLEAGYTRSDIARMVGLAHSSVGRYLDLLRMEPEIQGLIERRELPFETNGLKALSQIEDPERRVQVAQAAAESGMSGPGLARLITRMGLSRPAPKNGKVHKPSKAERFDLAGGRWNMVAQLGYKPAAFYEKAALETCQACAIYPIASSANCQECPAVELLRRLTGTHGRRD